MSPSGSAARPDSADEHGDSGHSGDEHGDWTGGEGATSGRTTAIAAVVAGLLPAVLAGVDAVASLVGLGSLVLLGWGVRRGSGVAVTVAAVALFGELLLAGAAGVDAGSLLAGASGVVLALTFGHASVDLATGAGRAPTRDHELAHVAGTSVLVGGAAAVIGLLSTVDWGQLPPLAVALLVLGAVALLAALAR